ncbi:MAG TPA: hypothetical protein VLW85_22400 [Myxococcales bacterium]|nr:hypothetical protein [Myxococcales bacterium]
MRYTLSRGWVGGAIETALWRIARPVAFLLPQPAPAPTLQAAAAA